MPIRLTPHRQIWRAFTAIPNEPKRLISAAPFRDRVVQHALGRVIEPIWEQRFIYDTYANRAGKGTHRALDRTQSFARRYKYFLQCDVKQFFPSIDHEILKNEFKRLIRDEQVSRGMAEIGRLLGAWLKQTRDSPLV